MFINIYLSSKNYTSLNTFVRFFFKITKTKQIKASAFLVQHSKPRLIKKFSVLKSPHVNKKAQDQFEFHVYKKQLSFYSFQGLKFLMVLKQIQRKLFADVKIKIGFVFNDSKLQKKVQKKFNPNKIVLTKNKANELSSKFHLQLLDMYGEFHLKSTTIQSLDSSVGRAKD